MVIQNFKIQIINVADWGSFLFCDGILLQSGPSLESFDREISNLIKSSKHCEVEYLPNSHVKFNKKVSGNCPYNTFYDVIVGTELNDFLFWFKK